MGSGGPVIDWLQVAVALLGVVVIPLAGWMSRLHADVQGLKSKMLEMNTVPERLVKIETLLEMLIRRFDPER